MGFTETKSRFLSGRVHLHIILRVPSLSRSAANFRFSLHFKGKKAWKDTADFLLEK